MGSVENVNLTREILIKGKVCMAHLLSISLKEALLNSQKLINKKETRCAFKEKKRKIISQQESGCSFYV